jgi:hypothetical protein
VMTKVEEYRARARECELRADQVHDLEVSRQFLDLARQWHQMATQWADLFFWRNADDKPPQLAASSKRACDTGARSGSSAHAALLTSESVPLNHAA